MADDDGNSSSSEYHSSDFEEVPNDDIEASQTSRIPPEGLTIVVPHDGMPIRGADRRKKNMNDYIRLELNRQIKEIQEDAHKTHLLSLISVGLQYNSVLRSDLVLGAALSTLPSTRAYPPKHMDLGYLTKFIKWFRKRFSADNLVSKEENDLMCPTSMEASIIDQLQKTEATSYNFLVCIFVAILRSLGIDTRLAWSLKPVSIKPRFEDLLKDPDSQRRGKPKGTPATKHDSETKEEPQPCSSGTSSGKKNQKVKVESQTKPTKQQIMKQKQTPSKPMDKKSHADSDSDLGSEYLVSDDSDFEDQGKNSRKRKGRELEKRKPKVKKLRKKEKEPSEDQKPLVVNETPIKSKLRYDLWAEVYLEEEERWISVDLTTGSVLCDGALEDKATPTLDYVLVFDNQGNVKDVTRRYAKQWLTATRKRRVDSEWWNESLQFFTGIRTAKDVAEDDYLDKQILNTPIPKSFDELKGHPLYALRRHLLRFEALVPDAITIGFVNNEPVYRRESVKTLHTSELWRRQAKVVRRNEVAYKTVKSRPKYDKQLGILRKDYPPLELFGEWQTEEYLPMPAVDGKIPRNNYGNVELFQDKMLPGGTVHLRLPGLQRIANKLGIDCARAVVGFDYHSGSCHPTFDGYIVCEEFQSILMDAYNQELAMAEAEEDEKANKTENKKSSKQENGKCKSAKRKKKN